MNTNFFMENSKIFIQILLLSSGMVSDLVTYFEVTDNEDSRVTWDATSTWCFFASHFSMIFRRRMRANIRSP